MTIDAVATLAAPPTGADGRFVTGSGVPATFWYDN